MCEQSVWCEEHCEWEAHCVRDTVCKPLSVGKVCGVFRTECEKHRVSEAQCVSHSVCGLSVWCVQSRVCEKHSV